MTLQIANDSKVLAPRRLASGTVNDVIGAFESETVEVFVRTAPTNEHIVLYVLAAMLVVAVVLMSIVKLDRVVTSARGFISTTAGSMYVSPLDSGIVRSVNVKAGQVVKQGQALATLDPTFTRADLVQLQQHMDSDAAAVAREQAELVGRRYKYSSADPYQVTQGRIWDRRQAQYRSDLANFDGQIHSAQAQMAQAQADVDKYQSRLKLAAAAESVYQPLLKKGYVSKLQAMQAADTWTEMSRLLADAQNQVHQYRQTAASLKAQRDSYIHKWYSDTASQLVLDRNDLDSTRDSLQKAQKLQELTSLDAPVDAIVLKVGRLSPGSVAAGGGEDTLSSESEPLFTLVPLNAPLEADIDVLSRDIGFIRVGDPVTLKLDAYPFIRHGTARGQVLTISDGSFSTDENNNPVDPYFKVRVAIKGVHLRDVPRDFRLIPGMTVTGDIKVGRRTILSYLVEGALRTGSEAMREP